MEINGKNQIKRKGEKVRKYEDFKDGAAKLHAKK